MKKINFKSKKTWLIIGAIVLVIGLIIWWTMKKKKQSDLSNPSVNPEIEDDYKDVPESEFPLKFGSQNNYVKSLQFWLLDNGGKLPVYGPDGKFGDETKAALKAVTGSETVTREFYLAKIYNQFK